MVMNFLNGGAAINVLSRHAGADIVVLDAGVATDLPEHPALRPAKVGRGTGNIATGPAMTREQTIVCLETGIVVRDCTSFEMPEYIRIGIRSLPDCQRLAEAMTAVLAGQENE